jgi:hypothetical protein
MPCAVEMFRFSIDYDHNISLFISHYRKIAMGQGNVNVVAVLMIIMRYSAVGF